MPKASKKTRENLYKIADNKIMDARIEIQKLISDHPNYEKVDGILYKLNWQCPKKIIDYFNPTTQKH